MVSLRRSIDILVDGRILRGHRPLSHRGVALHIPHRVNPRRTRPLLSYHEGSRRRSMPGESQLLAMVRSNSRRNCSPVGDVRCILHLGGIEEWNCHDVSTG